MDTAPHPLTGQARRLAEVLLAPHAQRVDQEGVPLSHIDALRGSGLLGTSAPTAYGGAGAPDAVAREVQEILAGACCSTWFVQTQHHTPVRLLARSDSPARDSLLGPLATGALMAGIAYAHVRAFPRVLVRATPQGRGWRFDGAVPWYTGWGLNDVMLLAGISDEAEVVFAFADARDRPGLEASPPMRLAALSASRTVSLTLDGLWLPDASVVLRAPQETWARHDAARGANASPAVFGVAYAALRLLEQASDTGTASRALRARLDEVRRRAYALAEHPEPEEHVAERLSLRTQAYHLMRTATTAAVVAGGGRTMGLDHAAQRLAREGLFLLIQGQTAQARSAHLRSLTAAVDQLRCPPLEDSV
ncbi:acyl-CoA dehydrogenase family protein [Streptomyces sp. NPDC005012]|uniref:acyl-CoA dehydrogenase family protein n=1 Tax=Streptomyces sp. NPDC005012 TaxID=3154558 RepID=UPI00339E4E66